MPEKQYDHRVIESKWQREWERSDYFRVTEDPTRPKY